jgi:hypothetical protein
MLGGSEAVVVLVLREDVVYVPEPVSEVLGVTEATGI